MSLALQNKRALVTGGSRGIGAAIVKRLAREGADVALTYVSKPDRANETVKAAQALTAADPGNAMAWFALARAKDQALADPGEVDAALDRAAKAARVHDYTFDLTKIAAQARRSGDRGDHRGCRLCVEWASRAASPDA